MNMLGLAKRVKARFLLASTSEVYGDPQEHPQTEAYFGLYRLSAAYYDRKLTTTNAVFTIEQAM